VVIIFKFQNIPTRKAKQISETDAAEAEYLGLTSYSELRRLEVRASEARRTQVAPYPSVFTILCFRGKCSRFHSHLKGLSQAHKRHEKYRGNQKQHVRDYLLESHIRLVEASVVILLPGELGEVRLEACGLGQRRAAHLHDIHRLDQEEHESARLFSAIKIQPRPNFSCLHVLKRSDKLKTLHRTQTHLKAEHEHVCFLADLSIRMVFQFAVHAHCFLRPAKKNMRYP
jgi:hypothetical protein